MICVDPTIRSEMYCDSCFYSVIHSGSCFFFKKLVEHLWLLAEYL